MFCKHYCKILKMICRSYISSKNNKTNTEQVSSLTNLSERVYEDHELLVENLLLWTRDSKNKLLFVERPDKTQLFLTPERFLLGPSDRGGSEYDDHSRNILLEEFFSSSSIAVPEVRNEATCLRFCRALATKPSDVFR